MRRRVLAVSLCVLFISSIVSADIFGTGANQFTIDFVDISGDTNPNSGIPAGDGFTFTGVNNDYRIGTYEITNEQWGKFQVSYGEVTGSPESAYDESAHFAGTNVPTNEVSWYEGAQFVNWLNTSTGHAAAYKFTGDQSTSNYMLGVWSAAESAGGTNLFRHKDAYYFMPTEDEWVKAAYWNGINLQTYATPDDSIPIEDVDSNYNWDEPSQPWDVGSGSEELNGTFDMMGNVWEWMESPHDYGDYASNSARSVRGGSYYFPDYRLGSSSRTTDYPYYETDGVGFRVASVPEPMTISLLGLGGLLLRRRK